MVSPTLGVGSFTVLETTRSAWRGSVAVVLVLLAVLGSNWSEWVIVAVLAVDLALTTMAWIWSDWGAVASTVPTVQRPVVELYVPWLGIAATNRRLDGKTSVTCTLVAGSGPLSDSVIV